MKGILCEYYFLIIFLYLNYTLVAIRENRTYPPN